MKKFIYAFLICLLVPCVCTAAYLIKLKNKGSYTVHQYWEEGNTIVFNAYGGKISIPKNKIESITDIDEGSEAAKGILPEEASEPEAISVQPEPSSKPADAKDDAAPELSPKTGEDALTPEQVKGYLDQKIRLVKRLKREQDALQRETDKKKEAFWIERRREKIKEARAEIEALRREVAEKNSGALPSWWNNIPVPADPVPLEESQKP